MKKYISVLEKNALFKQITPENILPMLTCLQARVSQFKKNNSILRSGEPMGEMGLVLEGSVQIIQEDFFGNRAILGSFAAGDLFGESLVCSGTEVSPVTVNAEGECTVMFIKVQRLVTTCSSACRFHTMLIENLLKLIARKNLHLNRKISLLSQRSTAEKLRQFFIVQAGENNKNEFTLSFSRSELADYLCVDRSAMSRELGRLQKSGEIAIDGKKIKLLNLQ